MRVWWLWFHLNSKKHSFRGRGFVTNVSYTKIWGGRERKERRKKEKRKKKKFLQKFFGKTGWSTSHLGPRFTPLIRLRWGRFLLLGKLGSQQRRFPLKGFLERRFETLQIEPPSCCSAIADVFCNFAWRFNKSSLPAFFLFQSDPKSFIRYLPNFYLLDSTLIQDIWVCLSQFMFKTFWSIFFYDYVIFGPYLMFIWVQNDMIFVDPYSKAWKMGFRRDSFQFLTGRPIRKLKPARSSWFLLFLLQFALVLFY